MLEALIHIAETFDTSHLSLIAALIFAGTVLILVNAGSHALIESIKSRRQRRDVVTRALRPVLGACERLVSRIADICVTHQESMSRIIRQYAPAAIANRLPALTALSMNRHESSAFRLAHFLALTHHFACQTADTPSFGLLESINYYLQHKIPVGLRGNLYIPLMSTKVQDELGARFLDCAEESGVVALQAGKFLSLVTSTPDGGELFAAAMNVFRVDTAPLAAGRDVAPADEDWRRLLALSHLCVYLIDFFQEFDNNCRWEEERLFFVRLLVQANVASVRHRYLYEPGDLVTGNYLDTYPGRLIPPPLLVSIVIALLERIRLLRPLERLAKRVRLNLRGGRYRRRHDTKRIGPGGVRIRAGGRWRDLRYLDDVRSVYQALRDYEAARMV